VSTILSNKSRGLFLLRQFKFGMEMAAKKRAPVMAHRASSSRWRDLISSRLGTFVAAGAAITLCRVLLAPREDEVAEHNYVAPLLWVALGSLAILTAVLAATVRAIKKNIGPKYGCELDDNKYGYFRFEPAYPGPNAFLRVALLSGSLAVCLFALGLYSNINYPAAGPSRYDGLIGVNGRILLAVVILPLAAKTLRGVARAGRRRILAFAN